MQVNLPENELNDFLRLATELQLKGVEVSEEQKSQFEQSSTKSERKKPITSKDIKTENSKIVLPSETMKPKYNWREATVGYKWDKDSPEKLRKALEMVNISKLLSKNWTLDLRFNL